jgi:tryptophan-rich sensory protein
MSDFISDLTEGKWLGVLDTYARNKVNNNLGWIYSLITGVVWVITFGIYQWYLNHNRPVFRRPILAPSDGVFSLVWIIIHFIIGYVSYEAHIAFHDPVTDILFLLNLLAILNLYVVEFVGLDPKVSIYHQIVVIVFSIIWMAYLVGKHKFVKGYFLTFYIGWMIYLTYINIRIVQLNDL